MRYLYACALCATAGWATMVHAEDGFCAITSISGEGASVLRQGRILAAVQAMPLSDGDQVATSAGVRMVISCADETRMTVGPDTTVDLGDMTPREQGWAAFLLEGIAAFARPVFGGARFEVRTPSAVASVRSTEWIVEVEAGATAVFVDSGSVSVAAREGGAVLDRGEGIDVTIGGTAGPVKTWGAARVQRSKNRLGLIGG